MAVADARAIVGGDAIVGLSTHSIEQAGAGARSGADYIAVGPVHATPTKEGRPAIGIDPVRYAAEHVRGLPWFAIGGIDAETVGAVVAAGARRAVVVRAIANGADPEAVTRELRAALSGQPVAGAGRGAG
jgi:thiamine-phosphate pyrophosphorylase